MHTDEHKQKAKFAQSAEQFPGRRGKHSRVSVPILERSRENL